jgi:hypothetical protein
MRGNVTMTVAKIAEYQLIVSLKPNRDITLAPTGPSGPMVFRRKKPTTVGGRTIGSVSTQSSAPLINFGVDET